MALSATMANGISVMNTFKASNTYTDHKDRFCLWHEQTPNNWKVWFDGLIVKWDSAWVGGTSSLIQVLMTASLLGPTACITPLAVLSLNHHD